MRTTNIAFALFLGGCFVTSTCHKFGNEGDGGVANDVFVDDAGFVRDDAKVDGNVANPNLDLNDEVSANRDSGSGNLTCRAWADCPAPQNAPTGAIIWSCIGPYTVYRCGPAVPIDARPAACLDDSACGPGTICREDSTVPTGWLGLTGLICAPPCASDADCPPTDKCASDGSCRGRTCAECPSYFSCVSDVCIIPKCSNDLDCPGGYCVLGSCALSLGQCRSMCL